MLSLFLSMLDLFLTTLILISDDSPELLNREVFVDFDEVWPVPSLNIGN
jgi:hypothetical protein